MKCPNCQRPIDHEASSCYSCNFSLVHSLRRFGSNKVRLRRVNDAADCLRVDDLRRLGARLDLLVQRFPQLNFAIYYGELNASISLSELSFWLLNQSLIEGELANDNDSTVLLIIDLETRQAGISLGYQTELLLSEEDCHRAMKAGRNAFLDQDFAKGTHLILKKIEQSLVKKARQLKKMGNDELRARLSVDQHDNRLQIPNHFNSVGSESAMPAQDRQKCSEQILVEN